MTDESRPAASPRQVDPTWPDDAPPFGQFGRLDYNSQGRVRCHVCGGWFDHLGAHTNAKHDLPADDYRRAFGLRQKDKLISEEFRATRRRLAVEQGLVEAGAPHRQTVRDLSAEQRRARLAKIERRAAHRRNTTEPSRTEAALAAAGLGPGGYPDVDYARWAAEYVADATEHGAYGTYTRLGDRWGITWSGARQRVAEAADRGLLDWTGQRGEVGQLTDTARQLLNQADEDPEAGGAAAGPQPPAGGRG